MGKNQLAGRLASYGWHGFRRDLIAGLTVAAVARAASDGLRPHRGHSARLRLVHRRRHDGARLAVRLVVRI